MQHYFTTESPSEVAISDGSPRMRRKAISRTIVLRLLYSDGTYPSLRARLMGSRDQRERVISRSLVRQRVDGLHEFIALHFCSMHPDRRDSFFPVFENDAHG